MNDWVEQKLIPKVMKVINVKPMQALKNGMLVTMPIIIIGSIFLLISNFPIPAFVSWVKETGLYQVFDHAYSSSFGIISFIAVIAIPYHYAKLDHNDGLAAGMIGLVCFIIMLQDKLTVKSTEISNIIDKNWINGQGMISAIIIGLLVGYIYNFFINRNIKIKLPEQVPANVASSFTALIPGAVLICLFLGIYAFFDKVYHTTMVEMIYRAIQIPLQSVTDSFMGALIIAFTIPFLWCFGIHGSTLIGGIMQPLLTANSMDNQAILDAGKELTVANGGHIVTQQFLDQAINLSGAGVTFGIVIFLVFFAKSKQNKTLGGLSGVPALFNINEPITFGLPIVLNPLMFIPFILTPILTAIITYIALRLGLVPLFGAVILPWTTPPVISGFLIAGWRFALLQIVILAMSFFVYYPFVKKIDNMNLKVEGVNNDDK